MSEKPPHRETEPNPKRQEQQPPASGGSGNDRIDGSDNKGGSHSGGGGGHTSSREPTNFLSRLNLNELLTLLVALGSLVVSYFTYRATADNADIKKAIGHLSELATQTKRQADNTRDLVTANEVNAKIDERARLEIVANSSGGVNPENPFYVCTTVSNEGKTPAENVKFGYILTVKPNVKMLFRNHPHLINVGDVSNGGYSQPASQACSDSALSLILGHNVADAVKHGAEHIYFYGTIEYNDIYKFHHWRHFCFIFNAPHGVFDLCNTRNEMDKEQQ